MKKEKITSKTDEMEAPQYEWACQWKTFLDGDYDRMISHNPLTRKPLSEEEAREEVRNMLAARIPARLIQRNVSSWREAPQ